MMTEALQIARELLAAVRELTAELRYQRAVRQATAQQLIAESQRGAHRDG